MADWNNGDDVCHRTFAHIGTLIQIFVDAVECDLTLRRAWRRGAALGSLSWHRCSAAAVAAGR